MLPVGIYRRSVSLFFSIFLTTLTATASELSAKLTIYNNAAVAAAKRLGLSSLIQQAASTRPAPITANTSFQPDPHSTIMEVLLQSSSPQDRERTRSEMDSLLAEHRRLAVAYQLDQYDVAGALAHYVYGAYAAYSGIQAPAGPTRALIGQLRVALASHPEFQRATVREKQDLYEALAILGVSLKQSSGNFRIISNNALHTELQQAAADSWRSLTQSDIALVRIGPNGLTVGASLETPRMETPSTASSTNGPSPAALPITGGVLQAALGGQLRSGGAFLPGKYSCVNSYRTKPAESLIRRPFTLDFYSNSEFRAEYPPGGWASWLQKGNYRYDPSSGQLNIQYGSALNMQNDQRDRESTLYFANAGNAAIVARDPVGYGFITTCQWSGASTRPSPTQEVADKNAQANDPETYLQPRSAKAPPPPPGSGGISGGFWKNGGLYYVGTTLSGPSMLTMYFRKDGYYFDGDYITGWDSLDCSRVRKDGTPLCGTYRIASGFVELNNKEHTRLKYSTNRDGTPSVGDWGYVPPAHDMRIARSFGSFFAAVSPVGVGPATAAASQRTIQFYQDGTFYDSTSASTLVEAVPDGSATKTSTAKRSGRYSINGYTLEIHYANGQISKRPFFRFTNDSVYMSGTLYTK